MVCMKAMHRDGDMMSWEEQVGRVRSKQIDFKETLCTRNRHQYRQ